MPAIFERSAGGAGWSHWRVGNVVFLTYQTAAPDAAVDHSFELIERVIAQHPSGIVIVGVFGERVPVPSSQGRRAIAARLAPLTPHVLMGCTVIEGESMAAMVKRVATQMMTSVLRVGYPHKTVRSVAMACDYVAQRAVDDAGAPLTQAKLFMAATGLQSLAPRGPLSHGHGRRPGLGVVR